MSFLNKPVPSVSLEGDVGPAVLMDLAGRYPALVEYMAAVAYPDGSARRTATLMLLVDPDGLKGCLNDRQEGRSLWVTSDTVEGVFAALEAGLTSPRPNWRKSSMPAPSAGRRK